MVDFKKLDEKQLTAQTFELRITQQSDYRNRIIAASKLRIQIFTNYIEVDI